MDAYEATKIVFSRIQSLDPENAAKIMGLLLIQDHGEKEMIRLAFGPESLLQSVVFTARKDLGLLPPSPPSAASPPAASANPFLLHRQNSSSRLLTPPPPLVVSSPSWIPPSHFSRRAEEVQPGCDELIDELQLHDQLSFLNDPVGPKASSGGEVLYPEDCRSPLGAGELFHYGMGWNGGAQRRSCSISDLFLGADPSGLGWKPCLYFARGYCKNGSSCRFLHGLPEDAAAAAGKMEAVVEQELLLRSKSQRIIASAAAAFPYSPTGSLPQSPSAINGKCMNFLLQQQQSESQRAAAAAAAAAALMLGGEDPHKLLGRPRMERSDFAGMVNPSSRQIYLTFPADSTFREEDVSNYFSIYGPVQDVRIPYQQKRMFGFVTFVYPETVKLILAKGNPHFVCDARVLVKPYKEKGKVPDKFRHSLPPSFSLSRVCHSVSHFLPILLLLHLVFLSRKQQGDFSGCNTPTGLDSRDPYDLQQLGARMLYAGSNHDALLRMKLEEQQELQQAIELQQRRFMGLQFLDLKRNQPATSASAAISPPLPITTTITTTATTSILEGDKSPRPGSATTVARAGQEVTSPKEDGDFQESTDHNLPDSPFAEDSLVSETDSTANASPALLASTLLPATSTLETMASFKSCFFQMPRYSSGSGAVGL